jgi:hypothetical protein
MQQQAFFNGVCVGFAEVVIPFRVKIKRQETPFPEPLQQMPKNIKWYLEQMLPYIKFALLSRGVKPHEIKELYANFCLFMLETNSKGKPRWGLYDSVRYGHIPYYKWFLNQVKFIVLKHRQEQREERQNISLNSTIVVNGINPVMLEEVIPATETDVLLKIQLEELPAYLQTVSRIDKIGNEMFRENILNIYQAKIAGETNVSLAERLEVPNTTMCLWVNKIKRIIHNYLKGSTLCSC